MTCETEVFVERRGERVTKRHPYNFSYDELVTKRQSIWHLRSPDFPLSCPVHPPSLSHLCLSNIPSEIISDDTTGKHALFSVDLDALPIRGNIGKQKQKTGEWIENLTLAQTRNRLKHHDVPTFEEMLQDQTLLVSGVHLYVDMKHTEIVRPVLHAVKQAVDRWGWAADRFVIATFRQLDLLQASADCR